MPTTDNIVSLLENLNNLASAGVLGFMLLFVVAAVFIALLWHRQTVLRMKLQADAQKGKDALETERLRQDNLINNDLRNLIEVTKDAIVNIAENIDVINIRDQAATSTNSKLADALERITNTLALLEISRREDNALLSSIDTRVGTVVDHSVTLDEFMNRVSARIDTLLSTLEEHAKEATQRGFEKIDALIQDMIELKAFAVRLNADMQYLKLKSDTQEMKPVTLPPLSDQPPTEISQ